MPKSQPKPPELIKGVVFDERFFDAAVRRAGGDRVEKLHPIPPNSKSIDYMLAGFGLELKIFMADPLDSPERQAAIERFIREEFPKGPIFVTATRRMIRLAGALAEKYWERIMGVPIQDRLAQAAKQIRATRTFVPGDWKGAALLVNSAGPSWDWMSFLRLSGKYHRRFPEIDAVFALNGVPIFGDDRFMIHFSVVSKKDGSEDETNALWEHLDLAIRREIEARTGKVVLTTELDPHAPAKVVTFQLTPDGVRQKRPKVGGS